VTPSQAFDAALRRGQGVTDLVGVDEAGRGPLAGPVVVAAVRLGPEDCVGLEAVQDSKLLTAARREVLYKLIRVKARAIAVAWAYPRAIERDNILAATLSAMRRAAVRAGGPDCLVVVDGNRRVPGLALRQLTGLRLRTPQGLRNRRPSQGPAPPGPLRAPPPHLRSRPRTPTLIGCQTLPYLP
jgi:hypothetical protein